MSQPALFEEAAEEPTFAVGELVARVSRAVASAFPAELWVRGEVHGFRPPNQSGHVYFELCERNNRRGPASTLPVALFRTERLRIERLLADWPDFALADGIEVRVKGRVSYGYGRVSLVMSAVDPVHTLGRLAADRQRVLRALAADGLLGANAALALPVLPLRVGLVTSAGSAAYEDVLGELTASGIGFHVLVADARVQGSGAEASMLRALGALRRTRCDVVLLVRGGGSRTDLVAFDGERLARAVAAMPVPVLAGVGHEIDNCVVDQVAARSFKTPTACAAAVVSRASEAIDGAEAAWQGVADRAGRALAGAERRLLAASSSVSAERTEATLRRSDAGLDRSVARLRHAAVGLLDRREARLGVAAAHAGAADPARALARGWSLTRTVDGRLVRDPADVSPGETLVTRLAGGTLRSTVEETDP
ncbi:MAG: exodeoxyribonuclease VII large subunit [Acidimicrobiia bacterium]